MKTLEYTTVDKSEWGDGPWQKEPDKRQWLDEQTGLPCLIVRGPSGSLCGYVGVSQSHPDFQKGYDDVDVDVHGGLTFADHCMKSPDPAHGICHLVEDGEDDCVWWLGFDTAHYMDYSPETRAQLGRVGLSFNDSKIYRDIEYVTSQIKDLARQLKKRG